MMGKIKNLLLPWDLDGDSVRDGKARKLIRPGEQIFSGRKTFEILPEIEGSADSDDTIVTKAYVDSVFGALAATNSYTLELTEAEVAAKRAVLPVAIAGDVTVTRLKLQGAPAFLRADETVDGFRVLGRNTIDWNGNTSGYFTGAEAGKRITVYYVGTPPAHRQLKVQEYHSWDVADVTLTHEDEQIGAVSVINNRRLIAPGFRWLNTSNMGMWAMDDFGQWQKTNGPSNASDANILGTFGNTVLIYWGGPNSAPVSELWESANAGLSWNKVRDSFVPGSGFRGLCAIDSNTFGYINPNDKTFRRSDNRGGSWQTISTITGLNMQYTSSVLMAALSDGSLIVTFGKGLKRSADRGATWSTPSGFPWYIEVWGIREIMPGVVIIRAGSTNFYISMNYGATWRSMYNDGINFGTNMMTTANFCAMGGGGEAIAFRPKNETEGLAPEYDPAYWGYFDIYFSKGGLSSWDRTFENVILPSLMYSVQRFGNGILVSCKAIETGEWVEGEYVMLSRIAHIYRYFYL